jgi:hypothetical protein
MGISFEKSRKVDNSGRTMRSQRNLTTAGKLRRYKLWIDLRILVTPGGSRSVKHSEIQ